MDFPRRVSAKAKDVNGDLLKGAVFEWFLDGAECAGVAQGDGQSSLELENASAVVSVRAIYENEAKGPIKLAQDQQSHEFEFDVNRHPTARQIVMKHFPLLVGTFFILLTLVLAFCFPTPTPPQLHLMFATFALGGGAFGGRIAGFISVNMTFGKEVAISAGGAAAIFVLLYFFVPAGT